ncbi:MAG: sigma-54-dependent Fis family transcriptional regulator [Myxococcales bacterium]|nr:sigma-54-dependent Fis family transcriptional regulator [Myxococcales bacterium]
MSWDLTSVDETVDSTRHSAHTSGSETASEQGRLCAVFPREMTITLDLGAERTVLGRAPDDLSTPPIHHPTVSRAHFVLEWNAELGTHVGQDLGSRNGSWIDGAPAGSGWHPLHPGSVLRIGDVILVYEGGHTLAQPDAARVSRQAVPGEALSVRRLRAQLARAAPDISPALIIGETGTGKEQIARELHALSGRKGELVAINCATFGEQLIESQLFGHVKGAFTGAATDQEGLFRAAAGGSLFLDEIGEMPLALQPKLLRAIQEREIRAVGSTRTERVDVRIIAATHQDLAAKARGGQFRQDLYARLALWELHVPPVRTRRADILTWLYHMLDQWAEERGADPAELTLSASAAETLVLAGWPENLRGLSRLVHELASSRPRGAIRAEHLPAWVNAPVPGAQPRPTFAP